jgi:bleomycin hydrolase
MIMKRILFLALFFASQFVAFSQVKNKQEVSSDEEMGSKNIPNNNFLETKKNAATRVKSQDRTGTCWSYSTTSLIESQTLKNKLGSFDISEMFTVRNIYVEKAKNYILRQGNAQFSEGGLGHDVIRSIATYGAVPQNVYSGLTNGATIYDHQQLFKELKKYLDSTLKTKSQSLSGDWMIGYNKILDKHMGPLPESFNINGKAYTPISFAKNILKYNQDDYVNITSFTHHPYYQPFIVEVPDNFSNGAYYNLPINEMIELVKMAINNGYTIMWDTDVSNDGFDGKKGMALFVKDGFTSDASYTNPDTKEERWDETIRQKLFENLTTQDDHLMHITGIEKTKEGKTYFVVKNSWGEGGNYYGFVNVSESYFAINTISLVIPKAALNPVLIEKLKLNK